MGKHMRRIMIDLFDGEVGIVYLYTPDYPVHDRSKRLTSWGEIKNTVADWIEANWVQLNRLQPTDPTADVSPLVYCAICDKPIKDRYVAVSGEEQAHLSCIDATPPADPAPDDRLAEIRANYNHAIKTTVGMPKETFALYNKALTDQASLLSEVERLRLQVEEIAQGEEGWLRAHNIEQGRREKAERERDALLKLAQVGEKLMAHKQDQIDTMAAQVAELMRENAESAPLMDAIREMVVAYHDYGVTAAAGPLCSQLDAIVKRVQTNNAGVTFLERLERAEKQVAAAREGLQKIAYREYISADMTATAREYLAALDDTGESGA